MYSWPLEQLNLCSTSYCCLQMFPDTQKLVPLLDQRDSIQRMTLCTYQDVKQKHKRQNYIIKWKCKSISNWVTSQNPNIKLYIGCVISLVAAIFICPKHKLNYYFSKILWFVKLMQLSPFNNDFWESSLERNRRNTFEDLSLIYFCTSEAKTFHQLQTPKMQTKTKKAVCIFLHNLL